MIGKTISHYKIIEKLGEGGMGEVYLAEDTKLKRQVALKFLPKEFSRDPDAKKRFMEEARSSSHLDHANICVIYDIKETDDGQLYIVMNYCKGNTLADLIKEKDLSVKGIIKYITQIAKGLDKAHSKGIIHCDIKPNNIISTEDDVAKIVDFGIAKIASEEKLISKDRTSGTIAYMSPEQVSNSNIDARSDIWSLGVVFYEMLTKQQPFQDSYSEALMYSIINEEPKSISELNPDVPPELEKIIFKMLSKGPNQRHQNIGALLTDIKKYQKGKLSSDTSRKPKWKIPTYIGGAVILLIALYFSFFNKPGDGLKSIAVLPFTTIDRTEESEIFGEGMHDDILTQIAKIGDLKVIARTSVVKYKNTDKSLKEIAKELNVSTVLEGSVRRSGDKIRIVTQLIDPENEDHIWAETYDRDYADIFAIQSEVAKSIASSLKASLSTQEKQLIDEIPTTNTEAYETYLQAKISLNNDWSTKNKKRVIPSLDKSVNLDQNFVQAWSLLSTVYSRLYRDSYQSEIHYLEKSKIALDRAKEINSSHPDVYLAEGNYYYSGFRQYDKALEKYDLALDISPNNSELLISIGAVKSKKGEWEESLSLLMKASDLDPHSYSKAIYTAGIAQLMRNWKLGDKYYDRAIVINPSNYRAYYNKIEQAINVNADVAKCRKILEEALLHVDREKLIANIAEIEFLDRNYLKALEIVQKVTPTTNNRLINTYYERGLYSTLADELELAQTYFDTLELLCESSVKKNPNDYYSYSFLAIAYSRLGFKKEAFEALGNVTTIIPENLDADTGTFIRSFSSLVYMELGEYDKAIEEFEYLLSRPSYLSVNLLKRYPMYDPIRNYPKFQELIKKYEHTEG